jgi:glutamyl-tRNA synthetase
MTLPDSNNTTSVVRTRFAPSPTGFLHLGGARTALFSWAFARHNKGVFVLRIEDTDLERSTPEAVQAILDSMDWLGMQPDEGPFYQMRRMDRYREVIAQMLADGSAYYCYSSPREVDAMRQKARDAGLKPRYDGTWRPEPGKVLPPVPADRKPVVRFKNPQTGSVGWTDLIKGPISFDNTELDDLIIARPDGTPTYNFCVVVDDWDMKITHVIRGDDHVNNTPRQINILRALGATLPRYGHVPMILGPDGDKLSKRHGAVNVMQYDDDGYLPQAMVNYLARLGWSHGDDELFTREQLVDWFDTRHLSKSAAQWDPKKLNWVNAHYIKAMSAEELAGIVAPRIRKLGGDPAAGDLAAIMDLLKDRAETLAQLAEGAMLFCGPFTPADDALAAEQLTDATKGLLAEFATRAANLPEWTAQELSALIKAMLQEHSLKMPKLAIPLRVAVTGQKHTPSIDAVLAILGRDTVLARLRALGGGQDHN